MKDKEDKKDKRKNNGGHHNCGRKPSYENVSTEEQQNIRVPRVFAKEAKEILVNKWNKGKLWLKYKKNKNSMEIKNGNK